VNGGYEIHCEILSAAPDLPRDQREARLRDYTGRFVARLEFYARKAPYNWFNFYDFWV
jgi:predicted LPLAT superfamily acyltransferase